MKVISYLAPVVLLLIISCGEKKGSTSAACEQACPQDTLKFSNPDHPLKPYVYVTVKNCNADTVIWSYTGMGVNRKLELPAILLSKDLIRCTIIDTSKAWLLFNDCSTKRGFYLKALFDTKQKSLGSMNSKAINSLDKKFSVADGLVAYTDEGNLFVEDMTSGKKAMMTFGEQVPFDFNNIHHSLDSVNITASRIWAKVKLKAGWKELEKNITLQ